MFFPFVEGLIENNQRQYSNAEMERNRVLSQKQRYYERQIREAKRSLKIAEIIGNEEEIQRHKKLLRNRQARIRLFVAEHDLTRQYNRERVIT